MRNPNADRKWIAVIVLLLVAEVLWLLVDLQWIQVPFFNKKSASSSMTEAGYIISSKKDLKRRGANSLIWEDTLAKDTLFYHDSVLTLSQSSAKLYLKDRTDLELSENTLVTLEEPEDKTKSEIRLRFSRGDLRARNPSFKTSVVGEDWVINLDKGSDILLRKDQGSYEFEVVSGAATLQTKNGEETLTQDKILKLNDDHKVEKVEKSTELHWKEKKPVRIYTLADEVKIPLEWRGNAKDLVINKAGTDEKNQAVGSDKQNSDLTLSHGSYKIRLKNESGLSEAKTVEVWNAPHIYLKKPLPRDRLKTNEPYEFIWTTEKGIKTYRVQFLSKATPLKQESSDQNFTTVKFDQEQDLKWQVQGEDEEGFVIPSLYNNEIYLRDEPLQAPKLKIPDVKKDTLPGALYKSKWQWLYAIVFKEALAKIENYEINFEWEPVTGADQYVLEVSSTPDFRNPELIKNLSRTSYTWKKVKFKKYYWRVAAGNAKGRMGLFSEPMELQLDEIKIVEAPASTPEPVTESVAAPVFEVKAEPELPVVTRPAPVETLKLPAGWGLALAPSYKLSKTKGERETNIELQGVVPFGLQLSYNKISANGNDYRFSLWSSTQTWKPSPATEFPIQKDLTIRETILIFDQGHIDKKNRWGLILHENFIPKRINSESLNIESQILLGARTSRLFYPSTNWHNKVGISVLTSGKTHELMIDAQTKYYLSDQAKSLRWSLGIGANAVYQSHKDGGGLQNNLIFLLELEQF